MANFFESLARKLGMRPPPPQPEIPDLLTEGQFGPHKGQPEASLNVQMFDVLGLGLDEAGLKGARERVIANTRKIIGEAQRAQLYAAALEQSLNAVYAVAGKAAPSPLPAEPVPVPRAVIVQRLREQEQRERVHSATYAQTITAQQQAAAASSRAIIAAGGEGAYSQQLLAQRRAAEAAAAAKAEWESLAAAGDPAGKAWMEWQRTLQATKHADTMLRSQQIYGKTPEARAQIPQLQANYNQAKALSDAWAAKFNELKRQRDAFIAQQQIAAGTHPEVMELKSLEAKRLSLPNQRFQTVADNVRYQALRKKYPGVL